MTFTDSQIPEVPCPLSRIFAEPVKHCRGKACPLFRTLPIPANHPMIESAVKRELLLLSGGQKANPTLHKQAVANVLGNPEAFTILIEREHYCGLGGAP